MTENSPSPLWSQVLRIADLNHKHPTRFEIRPESTVLKAISADLGLLGLRKLRFRGEIQPVGKSDWRLVAKIGATVHQACIVTLEPVMVRIEEVVERQFMVEMPLFEAGSEQEMPDDETIEILGTVIDTGEIMVESLALNLPLYPRAAGVEIADAVFTEPGKEPMKDQDARPFAGLSALRDKLGNKDN